MHTTLIQAAELQPRVTDPTWLIVDCRFDLTDPAAGEAAYRHSHLPNAVYAHLDRDLAGPVDISTGRHPLPDPDKFARVLSAWGLDERTQVIAYDADTGMFAARLWWLLRWVGHDAVAVLDGGLRAWRAAGLGETSEVPQRARTSFRARPRRNMWLETSEVAARVQRSDWRLLDARAPERFAGKVEPLDPVAGHVPGARNHPLPTNLGPDGKFLSAAELRERYDRSQSGVVDEQTIVMCGSGVTACHLALGMEIAGKPGAKLYAGSWSEWIRDPSRPVAKDDK